MRYITFTHVDVQTGIPVTIEPARNGPTLPAGCIFGFALESQYPTTTPMFYGQTDGPLDTPGILSVITKAEYDVAQAAEMAAREAKAAPADPYADYVPLPLLRQRIEKLGMLDPFAAYLAQRPALMMKVFSLERGVDPAYPDLATAFDEMEIPQAFRDYILAPPSAGAGDPPAMG